MATLRVNIEGFRKIMTDRDWSERDLAKNMGLAYSYVNRILADKRQPGAKFVAGAIIIGMTFEDAFSIDKSD